MKIKKTYYFIWILIFIFIFTGCSNRNQEVKYENKIKKVEQPQSGGELVLPITQIDTLNPIATDDKSVYYFNQLIYDGLIRLDKNLQPHSALAKSWKLSDDQREWIFELRNDITWHDGKSFSAEDVKFTINAMKRKKNDENQLIYEPYVENIKGVRSIGSHKVAIRIDSPLSNPIETFVFPIIPSHKFKSSQQVYEDIKRKPIGTGPYKVKSYDGFKNIHLVINDQYWGKKPYIEKIIGKMVPDKEAALTSVEGDEISVVEATNLDWEKYSENKSLRIYEYITQQYEFLAFNFNKTMIGDKNIRKALAYGIDRPKIIKEVYLGHGTVTDVPISPNSSLYSKEEKKYKKNIQMAKKLLSQSHWEDRNHDKWLEDESGRELSLTLIVNNDNLQRLKVSDMIASQLKEVGIKVNVHPMGWEEYERRILTGQFDVALGGWKFLNPWDIRPLFHSDYQGNTNFTGYSNPKMDQLLDEMLLTESLDLKKEKYKEIQRLFVKDLPYFSLYFINNSLIAKDYVKGEVSPTNFNIYNNIENWYVTKESTQTKK